MASVADGLWLVAKLLRADGIQVIERPGWEHRGNGGRLRPRAATMHHTASGNNASAAAVDRLLINGRTDLRGPLCNTSGHRDGTVALIAAGTANHAGRGGWRGKRGNSSTLGHEVHYDGRSPQTHQQLIASAAVGQYEAEVFDFSIADVHEHREWAPDRKPDRYGVNGSDFRSLVARYNARMVDLELGDRVIGYVNGVMDRGADVLEWQKLIIDRFDADCTADSVFGPNTRSATIKVQRIVGAEPDGLVGPDTLRRVFKHLKQIDVPPHDYEVIVRYGIDDDPNGPDRDAAVMLGKAHGFQVRLANDPIRDLVTVSVGYGGGDVMVVGKGREETRDLAIAAIRSDAWGERVRRLGRQRAGR